MTKARVLPNKSGVVVRRIGMIGATDRGEHVGLEIETIFDEKFHLLIPFGFMQKLILGLLTAGGMAYREQRALHGSSGNLLAIAGFSSFHPTDFEVHRGQTMNGGDIVLLRLKKDGLPIIDVTASVTDAKRIGLCLLDKADPSPASRAN